MRREHAACLSGDGPENVFGVALLTTIGARTRPRGYRCVPRRWRVPYEAYVPAIHEALDALWGPVYANLLAPAYLPLAADPTERLTSGARVADIGCGTGTGLLVLASTFPASTFVGYDLADAALDLARVAAAELASPT